MDGKDEQKSRFFYGHFSKAEINQLCKSGMGSNGQSPESSPTNTKPRIQSAVMEPTIKKHVN